MPKGMNVFDVDEHFDPADYSSKEGKKMAPSKGKKYVAYDAKSKKRTSQDKMSNRDRATDEESFDVDTDNAHPVKSADPAED